jgi:hypothetical protein
MRISSVPVCGTYREVDAEPEVVSLSTGSSFLTLNRSELSLF